MAGLEKVLVVGSGGREVALIKESLEYGVPDVYSTRDKDAVDYGIEGVINTGLGEDIDSIGSFAHQEKIGLVIIGPEAPLVGGLARVLRRNRVPVFGPDPDGAIFEADKTATDDFVNRHRLPNPDNSKAFKPGERQDALDYIQQLGVDKIVTKRVGLEGGKGVRTYTKDELEDAQAEVNAVAKKGEALLIQGRLTGVEISATFILDGKGGNTLATALARDHKSRDNGGEGPNTGGMGAVAPLSLEQASPRWREEIEQIGLQIAEGLLKDKIDYRGAIFVGLMAETADPNSALKILEFNVRLGDPETPVILNSLGGLALEYMLAAAKGSGSTDFSRLYYDPSTHPLSEIVCLASPGYPDGPLEVGLPIHMPADLPDYMSILFAGAKMVGDKPVSSGGRVVYIKKTALSTENTRDVYDFIGLDNNGLAIGQDDQVFRTDIGKN